MKFSMEKENKSQNEFEFCVLCGEKTQFLRSTSVDLRTDYIEGAGQLCRRCAAKLRGEELYARQNGYMYEIPYYEKSKVF